MISRPGTMLAGWVGCSMLVFTVPGVLVGGQLGPRAAARIPDEMLERGMGVLFLIVAAVVLAEAALA